MSGSARVVTGMPPPKGVDIDLSGKQTTLQHETVVINSVVIALSSIFVLLRFYTRVFLVHAVGLDDFMIFLAWVGCVSLFVVCMTTFKFGYGEHMWNVPAIYLHKFSDMFIGIGIIYVWTPACTKFSLLILYHRIDPGKWARIAVYGIAVFVFGYSLSLVIVAAGPCLPARHSDPKCLQSLNLFMAISNIFTDFLVIALPIPMLYKLYLPTKQKLVLGVVLSLGSAVTIVSIVRIANSYKTMGDPDLTFQSARSTVYSIVELNVGVICGCLVILKPFFQRYLPYLSPFSSQPRSRTGASYKLGRSSKGPNSKLFELKSVDPDAEKGGRGIEVHKEYHVRVEQNPNKIMSDGDSTEEIIPR